MVINEQGNVEKVEVVIFQFGLVLHILWRDDHDDHVEMRLRGGYATYSPWIISDVLETMGKDGKIIADALLDLIREDSFIDIWMEYGKSAHASGLPMTEKSFNDAWRENDKKMRAVFGVNLDVMKHPAAIIGFKMGWKMADMQKEWVNGK